MSGAWIRRALAIAALALAANGTTACGGGDDASSDRAAAGPAVKVGGIFDLSGATADIGTPYAEGIKGYVRYWNERGRSPRIELVSEDYKYDADVAEHLYASLKREGVVALQGWGTRDTEALSPRVTADRIPFMSASYAESLTDPSRAPFNFVAGTSYSDQMRIALRWISEQARGAEVASFHHDSSFGTAPQPSGAKMAERLGLGFTPRVMADGAESYMAQLRRALARGTRFVVIQNTPTDAARLARDIARLPRRMQIVCLNWCADELFIELAGKAAAGTVGVMPFAPASAKAAGLAQPRAFLAESGRSVDQEGLHYVQGWYTMAVMAEGIERAADKGRGRPTGDAIRRALEEMEAFDTGGVSAPVDFTARSHAGMNAARLYVVKREQWLEPSALRTGS